MCLDTNISIKPHLSSAIGHRAPLTVMFLYGFHCCHMVCRKPSINVHILPKDNPVLCFIRSYNTPVAIRLSSRIGFIILCCHISPQYMTRSYQALLNYRFTAKIFNSAKWVNRPASMINTAVAITQQRMNLVVYAGNVISATNTRYCDDFKDKMLYATLHHLLNTQ